MGNLRTTTFGNKRSPEQTLIHALSDVDGVKIAVVVFLDKNDYIQTGWSDGSMLKRIGMMDIAKQQMIFDAN